MAYRYPFSPVWVSQDVAYGYQEHTNITAFLYRDVSSCYVKTVNFMVSSIIMNTVICK